MNIIGFLTILFAATTWMPKVFNLNDLTGLYDTTTLITTTTTTTTTIFNSTE